MVHRNSCPRQLGYALAFVFALVLSACGGGDEASPNALVQVVADELGGDALNDDENQCVAESVVAAVGADQLAEMGITSEGVSAESEVSDEQEQLVARSFDDGIEECVDLREVLNRAAGDDVDGICALDQLSDSQLQIMYGLLTGRADLTEEDIQDLNTGAAQAEEICNPGVVEAP